MASSSKSPTAPARRRRAGWIVLKLALVALAVYLTYRLAAQIGWATLAVRVRETPTPILGMAALLLFARFLVWQARWGLSLRFINENPTALRRLVSLLASVFVNHITPSVRLAGGLLRARYVSRSIPAPFGRHYGAVLYDQLVHNAATGAFTWLSIGAASWLLGLRGTAVGVVATLAGVVVWIAVRGRRGGLDRFASAAAARFERRRGSLGPLGDQGRELGRTLLRLLRSGRLFLRAAAMSLLFILCNLGAQWALFRGLGVDVELTTVAAVVGLGTVAGFLTGTPGGVATTEAAMIALYVALGMSRIDAVAGTVLYRGLHYVLVLALGLPSVLYLELVESLSEERGPS